MKLKCKNPIIFKKIGVKKNSVGKVVDDLQFVGHLSSFRYTNLDKSITGNRNYIDFKNYVVVPCGRCINCRLSYAKTWADRLTLTGHNYFHKYFITLTYDDENIKRCKTTFIDDNNKSFTGYSVVKSDLQDFFKRLRYFANKNNLVEKDIKYYCCAEYGEKNSRPHYHIILFGFAIPDLQIEYRQNGYDYFQSDVIRKLWSFGRIQVNNVSYESISYVARYCTKKVYGNDAVEYYLSKGIVPEFCLMSKGLGKEYFHSHKNKIYSKDCLSIEREGKVYHIKPFRYFDKLFDLQEPEKMKLKKLDRKSHQIYLHSDKYGYDYLQQSAVDNKYNMRKGV